MSTAENKMSTKENKVSAHDFDKEAIRAGIPKMYLRQDFSLSHCGEVGEQLLDWLRHSDGYKALKSGTSFVEIVSDSTKAQDAFYLAARACLLHSIPVAVTQRVDMIEDNGISEDTLEYVRGAKVLFIEGLVPDREDDLSSPQKSAIEWFCSRWLMNGRSIVHLSAGQIKSSNYAKRFVNRAAEHQKLLIQNV